jgi:hypothetical protein
MPGSLETITYQAQVLGKGSIKPELVQQQQLQQQASTPFANATGASGAHGTGSAVLTPFRDALSRFSRLALSRAVSDRGAVTAGSQVQPQASDTLPRMQFLQTAAESMRTEQQRQGLRMPSAKQPTGAAAASGLHTVVEVRRRSVEDGAAEAAAAAAVCAAAAAAPGLGASDAAGQQQRPLRERLPSFDLRATDVVSGHTSLRRRMLGGQPGGDEEEPKGDSPRAPGEGSAGFVARSAWPLVDAGHLAHSGLKRRSQNYS